MAPNPTKLPPFIHGYIDMEGLDILESHPNHLNFDTNLFLLSSSWRLPSSPKLINEENSLAISVSCLC
jgi:hypothetical protein